MKSQPPLVSIIIPTFNRAHLIGETLDSILAQTYVNWECLVVDDGSSDDTEALLIEYQEKDDRINYFVRPLTYRKGGNVCRNIGLEKARGAYIVFFDSDDLMTADHLQTKLEPFNDSQVDFTITKTEYFNKPEHKKDHNYTVADIPITLKNYLAQHINWLTLDICIRAEIAKKIRFNEKLQAGQEFNFYSKLLTETINGVFIDKVVSLRRYHEDSIQSKLIATNSRKVRSFLSKWVTYQDLKPRLSKREKRVLFYLCIKSIVGMKRIPNNYFFNVVKECFKLYGIYGFYFLALLILIPYDRGYFLHKKLRSLSK